MKFNYLLALFLMVGFVACDIEQTEEGSLPDIDVDVDPGNMPEYNVDWVDIDVGTRTTTITVPKVVVVMEEEEVEVPVIDFDAPDASPDWGDKEERALMVAAEVEGEAADLDIREVYVTGNNLIVLAELKSNGQDIGDQKMRVEDRLYLNAPENLNVRYYIMGDRPERSFNKNYKYIRSKSDIKMMNDKARKIYG